jgi:lincosamide and streptogramin A transport system ATP-binding/permease protein
MSTIILRGVAFSHPSPETTVFDNVDLLIDSAWRTALVGRNGRGKTTLLRLIHRELTPQRGELLHALRTCYFPAPVPDPSQSAHVIAKHAAGPFAAWESQMAALLADGSAEALDTYGELESRYQQAGGYEVDARLDAELEKLGISSGAQQCAFATLSGGEQTRVLIAGLFAAPDAYPLIDEPTNHLDSEGRRRLADYLAGKPGFLLASHDRAFLEAAVDHVVAIESGKVSVHAARFSVWLRERDARRSLEQRQNEQLKREMRSLTAAAQQRRAGAASRERDKAPHTDKGFIGRRAAKQMKRALVIERRIERAVDDRRRLIAHHEREYALKFEHAQPCATPLLTATALSATRGGRLLWKNCSMTLERGARIAIAGANGCGKTTLLDILSGCVVPESGELQRAAGLQVVLVRQQPYWTRTAIQAELERCGIDRDRYRQVLGALGMAGDVIDHPIERLSPGQLKKIELAFSFAQPAHIWIWDEPLNYVDLETREQIEAAVLRDGPTLLFVEHDRTFVERVATERLSCNRSPD